MDMDLVMTFRNCILVGTVATTVSCVPDVASRITQPLLRIRCWIKGCRQFFRTRLLEKRTSAFWEIDMTKFEP